MRFENVRQIGLISDTHGLMRPQALDALRGSDLIIHAGDVGNPEILAALSKVAQTIAVRGNIDKADLGLPATALVEAGGVSIYVLHDLKQLAINPAASGVQMVISGHSHKPCQTEREGVLYINPGSAGRRRFRLPVTIAQIDLTRSPLSAQFIDLNA